MKKARKLKIKVSPEWGSVSALLRLPEKAFSLMVLSHGAGAGMDHPFMEGLSQCLAEEGVGTLRFNFLYMENGGGPDRPKKAHPAIQAAVKKALPYAEGLRLLVGGKSFGGRMSSQVAAEGKLDAAVRGIVYFGFPLHAPGKPGMERAAHLSEIKIPQLFLQGTRDTLANFEMISQVVRKLRRGQLVKMEGGDHSFKTLKKSGISHEEMIRKLAKETSQFARKVK